MEQKEIIIWRQRNWKHVKPPGKYKLDCFHSCFHYWSRLRQLNDGSKGTILHFHFELREMIEYACQSSHELENVLIASEPLIDHPSFGEYMVGCELAWEFNVNTLKQWFDGKYSDVYSFLIGQYMDGIVIKFARKDKPTNDFFREGVFAFITRNYLPEKIKRVFKNENKEEKR